MQKKYLILFILSLLSVITFLDRNALSIAGLRITQDLGLSESQFGWILTAFTLSYGLLEIPMGLWGDRFGEKRVIARIVLWWSLFTAVTGLVTGFASLFVVRFLFGAGEAGAYPNTAIAIKKWFPPIERGRAQSFIWMASRIGGAIAPFIVVPLQIQFGWRTTFYFLGAIGLLWVVLWWLLYPTKAEPPVQTAQDEDSRPWQSNLYQRNFWLLLLMYYCYASGVFFFISWLPKYLQSGRGIAESELAYSAALPFLMAAFGCWLGGFSSDWLVKKIGGNWGRKIVPVFGLALSGLAMIAATQVGVDAAVVLLALGLALMDVTAPVAWAIATDLGGRSSGAITGAMNSAGLLGGTVASLGIGYLISFSGSYNVPVVLIGIQLLLGAAIAGFLRVKPAV
ncbi:MAG: MFS transporter [Bacteroidota bacterium]|jgi:ACS family glucarate transporter-like MFS transporter|nr:MFS transporter [Cytophagales bacterium]MCE2955598.1 MFS transporter [Flammeovirgaceae bacterium]MCZ8071980.1 MFS transporter [Cytophagales bacterium]